MVNVSLGKLKTIYDVFLDLFFKIIYYNVHLVLDQSVFKLYQKTPFGDNNK